MLLQRVGMSLVLLGGLTFVAGCGDKPAGNFKEFNAHDVKPAPADHGHGDKGPHGGDVVELEGDELHAEVVLNEDEDEIAVHILGGDAKTAKAIEAKEIELSFVHGDMVEKFPLVATKQDGDAEGQASLFKVKNEDAMEELHHHGKGTLTIVLGEKKITGTVKHSH